MILVAGEALVDVLVSADGAISAVPGGGPFNVVRALARLGCPASFFGQLSSDGFGQELREALRADGVALAVDKPVDLPTTLAIARLDDRGAASYTFYLAGTSAASLAPTAVSAEVFTDVSGLHVGSLGLVVEPMAAAVHELVRRVPSDVLVMVDVNARPAVVTDLDHYCSTVLRLLGRADVVKASTDDLDVLVPGRDVPDAALAVLATGAGLVLVTDGPRPVRVFGSGFEAEVAVPEVAVVDTVGAGDAFGAGFLAWWHRRDLGRDALSARAPVVEAVERAGAVAALTCTRRGADSPRLVELDW